MAGHFQCVSLKNKTRNGNDETKPETCAYANAGGRDRGIARDYEINLYLQLAVREGLQARQAFRTCPKAKKQQEPELTEEVWARE